MAKFISCNLRIISLFVCLTIGHSAVANLKTPDKYTTAPTPEENNIGLDGSLQQPTVQVGSIGGNCHNSARSYNAPIVPLVDPGLQNYAHAAPVLDADDQTRRLGDLLECRGLNDLVDLKEEYDRNRIVTGNVGMNLDPQYLPLTGWSDSYVNELKARCNFGESAPSSDEIELHYTYPNIDLDYKPRLELQLDPRVFDLPHTGGSKTSIYESDMPKTLGDGESVSVIGSHFGIDSNQIDGSYFTGPNGIAQALVGVDAAGTSTVSDALRDYASNRYMNFGTELQYRDWSSGGLTLNNSVHDVYGFRGINIGDQPSGFKYDGEQIIGQDVFTTVFVNPLNRQLSMLESKLQEDFCYVKLVPTDHHFQRLGINDGNSWGERFDDQWAIKRVGFGTGTTSAWSAVEAVSSEIIVAIVDSGLDWDHVDIDHNNLWRNEDEIPNNGIDDDRNGYVDDMIGWDFVSRSNRPWDHDGHGTIVAGIIAAAHNDIGIAGINPKAKLMIIKALDGEGRTRASLLAKGIVYAVDNGAKIINLSVGGENLSAMTAAAIEYAAQAGVLVVAASGNEGQSLDNYAMADYDGVLTVGATYLDDYPADFSNYGEQVDIAAPGVEILSLRARLTDTNYSDAAAASEGYIMGDFAVGDRRYIKASGTSFATPIVTGVASLVWATRPELSAEQVKTVLTQSADDLHLPGRDDRTGHGMVNANRALTLDPNFSIDVRIDQVNVIPGETTDQYELVGAATTDQFKRAWVTIGSGENPTQWKRVGKKIKKPVASGTLMTLPATEFAATGLWQIVLHVEHANGVVQAFRKPLRLK